MGLQSRSPIHLKQLSMEVKASGTLPKQGRRWRKAKALTKSPETLTAVACETIGVAHAEGYHGYLVQTCLAVAGA